MTFQPTTCYHCDRPACVEACPTGAMQQREDGVVFSDLEICIGCQTCAIACPFGVPQLNPAIWQDRQVRRLQRPNRPRSLAGLRAVLSDRGPHFWRARQRRCRRSGKGRP